MISASEDAAEEMRKAKSAWLSEHLKSTSDSWRRSQFNRMLEELAQKVLTESLRLDEGVWHMERRLDDAYDLLSNVQTILCPDDRFAKWNSEEEEKKDKEDRRHIVWYRKDPNRSMSEGIESEHFVNYNQDELHIHVAEYLERPWLGRSLLEWALVDSMLYREISQFSDALKRDHLPGKRDIIGPSSAYLTYSGDLNKMSKAIFKEQLERAAWKLVLLVVGPPALSWYLVEKTQYDSAGAFIGVSWGLIFALWFGFAAVRWTYRKAIKWESPKAKLWRLWHEMANVYKLTKGPVVNPVHLREALERTRDLGAVWDRPLYAMVDRIVARDPSAWVISEGYAYEAPPAHR